MVTIRVLEEVGALVRPANDIGALPVGMRLVYRVNKGWQSALLAQRSRDFPRGGCQRVDRNRIATREQQARGLREKGTATAG